MSKSENSILIVEDDDILADIYQTKFDLEGFNSTVAKDGLEGEDKALKNIPDLILLDLVMPKMNGYDLLKFLKSNEKTKDIPIIILSNLGQDYEVSRGKKLGAEGYLIKANHTPAEVVEYVVNFLKI